MGSKVLLLLLQKKKKNGESRVVWQRCQLPDNFLPIHLHVLLYFLLCEVKDHREESANDFPLEGKGLKHLKEEINIIIFK